MSQTSLSVHYSGSHPESRILWRCTLISNCLSKTSKDRLVNVSSPDLTWIAWIHFFLFLTRSQSKFRTVLKPPNQNHFASGRRIAHIIKKSRSFRASANQINPKHHVTHLTQSHNLIWLLNWDYTQREFENFVNIVNFDFDFWKTSKNGLQSKVKVCWFIYSS